MPLYFTIESFSCGDSLESGLPVGEDISQIITETIDVNTRCLRCLCQELLHLAMDGGLPCIPQTRLVELSEHFETLQNTSATRKALLPRLKAHIFQPTNAREFQAGVIALSRFSLHEGVFIPRPEEGSVVELEAPARTFTLCIRPKTP